MPSQLVIDSWNCEVSGQEPWPDDVQLFQPYETEQILLPDNANCLAVQTFLKMCDLKYVVEYRTNAEEMSPSGRVPFIKCGACLISDFEPITSFVSNKGISLSAHLDEVQKADMRAFMSLVNTVLGNAENFITWVDSETYTKITKPRYGSVHPFPLNHWLCFSKRRTVLKKLSALGWANKSLENVYDEVEKGCSALSDRLEKSKFFFGDQPTELDALVFGHIYTILTTPLPNNRLASTIRGYPNLVDHCKIIEKQLFDCYGGDPDDFEELYNPLDRYTLNYIEVISVHVLKWDFVLAPNTYVSLPLSEVLRVFSQRAPPAIPSPDSTKLLQPTAEPVTVGEPSCSVKVRLHRKQARMAATALRIFSLSLICFATHAAQIPPTTESVPIGMPDVRITCKSESMTITVESSSGQFDGMIYPRGLGRNSSCLTMYSHAFGPITYDLPLSACNTMSSNMEDGTIEYYNTIVVQPHRKLVTSQGKGFHVRCKYTTRDKMITNDINVK
ncbi:hypothetical protein GE061_002185 [Apolygus lucorum]|uniref:ZP domain-containing protein n=1 Tax=Apolygus lucorum TaxID=248454 RepID=A0A8S9X405_APOLU|nr:hypothetical protein GE061_002185 [Apolygus lucorum]